MSTDEKLKIMAATVKPIINLLQKRQGNKIDALKAYDVIDGDPEIKKIREIEAVKLRHEVEILKDLIDIVTAMYPNG
ncbi:MAG: hypothetical protein IPJ81_16170 [Chitinophagaceae bacterium]|nr:hypothetical protein [Chitinophagaceae bacterium]